MIHDINVHSKLISRQLNVLHVTRNRIRSSATTEIACNAAIQGHSRSSIVVPVEAAYGFLLAFNSNLTFIFKCSWYIMPSLQIYAPSRFQVEMEKRRLGAGGHALVSGCPQYCTIQPYT